jgi:transposase
MRWPLPEGMDDGAIEALIFPGASPLPGKVKLPDMAWVHRELKRKGVTRYLLWQEFCETTDHPCSYSRFCEFYRCWRKKADLVMRQDHKAGEKMFVDYAGQTVPVTDPLTGEVKEASIFVATLGASSYTYAQVSWHQDIPSFLGAHVRAFEYFKGVPEVIVPDNLKSGVKDPCYYEPDINPSYQEMASYYGTAVIPARVARPKDKAKVEAGVQVVERWILAALRNRTFFSLGELNETIGELLEKLNAKRFQKLDTSRRELFEAIERPALKPLPARPYQVALWKMAKVNIDYHIEVTRHYYSVPYQLVGKTVDVRITEKSVEIFHKGKRVTGHVRSYRAGHHTTREEHMPPHHRAYKKSPGDLIKEAERIGPHVGELAKAIMEHKGHPVQGYRAVLGIMKLVKAYGPERLEGVCTRALAIRCYSYRSVKSILDKGVDRIPAKTHAPSVRIEHANLRGAGYYGMEGQKCS